MKSTESNTITNSKIKEETIPAVNIVVPARSLRPQKSMMKVKSLRPKKLNMVSRVISKKA